MKPKILLSIIFLLLGVSGCVAAQQNSAQAPSSADNGTMTAVSPTDTLTTTATVTATGTLTVTATPTMTAIVTGTVTPTATMPISGTATPTTTTPITGTPTVTATSVFTGTPTPVTTQTATATTSPGPTTTGMPTSQPTGTTTPPVTPAPTKSPTPTPTQGPPPPPTPLPKSVFVNNQHTFTKGSSLFVVGDVVNGSSQPVYAVKVIATFYDSAGKLVGAQQGQTFLPQTVPTQANPFKIELANAPSDVSRSDFALTWDEISVATYDRASVISQNTRNENGVEVYGELRNDQRTPDQEPDGSGYLLRRRRQGGRRIPGRHEQCKSGSRRENVLHRTNRRCRSEI